jgi:carbon-monoxide dehydrogenase medium subunit
MKAAPFDYVRPATLEAACAALAEDGVATAAIAGGQSLLPMLSLRVAIVDRLVDIGRLEELKEVTLTPDVLRIGALITHAAIEDGNIPDVTNGLMRRVAGGISYRAIRHHGTIGGSVALADPAADWPGCLMALGATVRIAGLCGERSEPVADFIKGQYATSLSARSYSGLRCRGGLRRAGDLPKRPARAVLLPIRLRLQLRAMRPLSWC